MVWSALSRLTTKDRAMLVLKDMEGMRYQQVADLLDVPDRHGSQPPAPSSLEALGTAQRYP